MQQWCSRLDEMKKKKDEEKREEEERQKLVSRMIASAGGGAGIDFCWRWRDVKPLSRCEEKRKEWAKHGGARS